jgi:phage terminase large subunit GpA-like protein
MPWRKLALSGLREEARAASAFFAPKIKRPPSQWAVEVRRVPAGTSPLSTAGEIAYSHEFFPHTVEPMDAADDPSIRRIVLWWAIREGKTSAVCMNILGRTVTDDPGNIYSVNPTDSSADTISDGDIEPMIGACLEKYFVAKKSRDSGRTKEFKKFAGGWVRIFSSGSPAKFRGTSVRVLFLHELDGYEETSSIFKAFGRTTGFADAIIVMESTGTIAATFEEDPRTKKMAKVYHSNIEEAYDQGDKRKWFCRCKSCGHLQWLKYEQIKWPPGKMAAAKYHCEKCDYAHSEKEWRKMAAQGRWYPTAGLTREQEDEIEHNWKKATPVDPTVRSYWRNGFTSLLPTGKGFRTKLHQFAAEGEEAKSSPERHRVWMNEIAAQLWDPESSNEPPPDWRKIYDGREDYPMDEEKRILIPRAGLVVTAMVDVQGNRLEVLWRAFGREYQSWAMRHRVIEGSFRNEDTWKELAAALRVKLPHQLGLELLPTQIFIDGGKWGDWVKALWFDKVYREPENQWMAGHCRASKGVGLPNAAVIYKRWAAISDRLKRGGLYGAHIGTWEAKDTIYDILKGASKTGAVMQYPKSFGEDFFQQLTAETMELRWIRGFLCRTYENKKAVRNEALDLEVGCLAAFKLYPRDMDAIEAQLLEAAAKPQQQAIADEEPREEAVLHGGGWSL